MGIELSNISKHFGEFRALDKVKLSIPDGRLTALLGPSGSGKTTLLRIIAGLEHSDPGGKVTFDDLDMAPATVRQRRVGFVFQHYALFRHMSVFENVAFGLRVRPRKTRPVKEEIHKRVHELLQLVQLENMSERFPSQLSGGQRQRVALARALAVEPRVLLLDEPFGALDAKVRKDLRLWLRRLHDEIHLTSVFVTHDQEEALEVADQVVILNKGHIEQVGAPDDVYEHPANPFVFNFLGRVNLFHGRLGQDGRLEVEAGDNTDDSQSESARIEPVVGYVRPHDIQIFRFPRGDEAGIAVRVEHLSPAGPLVRVYAVREDNGQSVEVEISRKRYRELMLMRGDTVYASLGAVKIFDEDYSI